MPENFDFSSIDLLIGIGYFLPEGRKGFRYCAKNFHRFFYEIKPEFPSILGQLAFTWESFPHSPELSDALGILRSFGLLDFSLITPTYYQFNSDAGIIYQNRRHTIGESRQRALFSIAREFDEAFGETNRFSL